MLVAPHHNQQNRKKNSAPRQYLYYIMSGQVKRKRTCAGRAAQRVIDTNSDVRSILLSVLQHGDTAAANAAFCEHVSLPRKAQKGQKMATTTEDDRCHDLGFVCRSHRCCMMHCYAHVDEYRFEYCPSSDCKKFYLEGTHTKHRIARDSMRPTAENVD